MIYENCEIGDIVLVDSYKYPNGNEGKYHYFVIMAITDDEITAIPLEYFGFIVSSHTEKNNDANAKYPYNEPVIPDEINRLPKRSHVKCDELVSVNPRNVIMKLGSVTTSKYKRFMELYEQSLDNN